MFAILPEAQMGMMQSQKGSMLSSQNRVIGQKLEQLACGLH